MRASFALLILALIVPPANAQSEDRLRTFFEGRSVTVKIEMPGAEEGVDVYPGRIQPINFPKHAGRLKKFGTALRRGDEVLVTKIKVKKNLIEFQLGGEGYGTFGDDASSSSPCRPHPRACAKRTWKRISRRRPIPPSGGASARSLMH